MHVYNFFILKIAQIFELAGRMEFWRQMFGYPENLADDYLMPEN